MRKEYNDRLVGWIQRRAANRFSGDIALVAAYGSHFNGTSNPWSDVDCYFIPKGPRGEEFGADFILAGVGYDLFPISWERAQGIARLQEPLTPLIGDVTLLYADSPQDLERFHALQGELSRCLADEKLCHTRSLERFQKAVEAYSRLGLGNLAVRRAYAGRLLMLAAESVALENGAYFHFGLKRQFEELQELQKKPPNFLEAYLAVIRSETAPQMEAACKSLLRSLGAWLGADWQPVPVPPAPPSGKKNKKLGELAPWYEELCSTFQKLRVCRDDGNWILAFLTGACLQEELESLTAEYELPFFSVLDAYCCDDLGPLVRAADAVERDLAGRIEVCGGHIKRFATFEEFESACL